MNSSLTVVQEIKDFTKHLNDLLEDEEITEILILSARQIWYEKKGCFYQHTKIFENSVHYQNFLHQICDEASIQFNYEYPFADGQWRCFRLHICSPPISPEVSLTLRRLRQKQITLDLLYEKRWCDSFSLQQLKKMIYDKKNILVVGSTGSGKTTLLNSLIWEAKEDRCVFIEDTPELLMPNLLSQKLLTRKDYQGQLPEITQTDLLRQSLRMRPDRLIVGEVRGGEAKDLLMALSTGHKGSMTSLHAGSAAEALLRLEMLVQMGAPEWNLHAIRRLIQLTVDCIVVTEKQKDRWLLKNVYCISSLEEFGFTVESIRPET